MRTNGVILGCILSAIVAAPAICAGGQALLPAGLAADATTDQAAANAPDAQVYADGKKAIHESRWADAVKTFDRVAGMGGPHAANALYWKAYALNKLGQGQAALGTCIELRTQFAGSNWVDDCGALEIEIKASKGEAVKPQAGQSDELKLLALATLMRKDPTSATAQIQEIVQGDASEMLKEGAVFILGQQVPDSTYPQIVRISYMEGDVRVARASENEKSKKPEWETAVMNLPLFGGDSIVTGKDGRVEIEFENASTMYLAENSVLNFQDLHTTGGVPHTELALVSGTITTHLDSLMGGETFLLRTPTEILLARYPEKQNLRISSYLDGISLTSVGENSSLNVVGAGRQDLASGRTLYFADGRRVTPETMVATDYSAFDLWVADRYASRTSTDEGLMKDAGLTRPIPGLAEMANKGQFFDCPPYGKCWMPSAPKSNAVLVAPPTPPPTPKSARPSAGGPTNGSNAPYATEWFPCMNEWYGGAPFGLYPTGYVMNPGAFYYGIDPYSWAVCHSGWWLYNNDRRGYMWVAGPKRHHRCPVRWVKYGRNSAVVPLHPKDVKGAPPINRVHGFEPVKGRDGLHLNPVAFDPVHPIEVMKNPPHEFHNVPQPVLARAEAPRMEARALRDNGKTGLTTRTSIPMTFNHQQGFVATHQIMQGGHPVSVSAPVGRVGGGVAGGGFSGHSGGSGPGFGAVGVSHGGGGFSGGGGGGASHAGGSVSAPSSTSTSAPAATSSAAPASGSHK